MPIANPPVLAPHTVACDTILMRKLINLVKSNPEEVILKRKDITYIEVTIPKKCVGIRKPNKRQLTEEQRQSIAERLHASKSQKAL